MASTRVTRLSRTVVSSLLVVAAALAAPLAAHALPGSDAPTTSAQATAKLSQLAKSSEKLSEQLNQAQIDVRAAQRAAAQAARAAAAAEASARSARQQLASLLASQYKAASFSRTAALLASRSTDSYLQTIQSMNLLTQHQSVVALTASKAIATADAAAARAKAAVATAVAKRDALAKRQADLKREVAKYKKLLATLTAAERAKYFNPVPQPSPAAVNRVMVHATAAVAAVAAAPVSQQPVVHASGGAGTAIAEARAQLGKPYQYGASGPNSFDCSGLTAWAWRAAGVSLPHSAASQQGMGTPVSRENLQPGDLVFFGSPAYHVGIYVGDGMMIHAPTSGDVVKMSPLAYMSDYSGATRVG
ncbi:MAG: C40 family peptidase [Actinobacteria bacterium]|nr:C40 family peptidase [Actinomycetota bacterium]